MNRKRDPALRRSTLLAVPGPSRCVNLVVALIAALFDLAASPVMAADNPPPEADGAQALYDEAKQQGWTHPITHKSQLIVKM